MAADDDWQRIDHASLRLLSRASDVVALYDGFDAVGLHYGPRYRTLTNAWGGASDALARLRARSTHEGTQVHPADLDDALCTSAAIASSGDGEKRLPFAVDDAQLCGTPGIPWAVVARRAPDAVSVRLGALDKQSQAQLDGFKSRALRAKVTAQRLYITEWHQLEVASGTGAELLVISDADVVGCELLSSRVTNAESVTKLRNGEWSVMATATQHGLLAVLPLFALEVGVALVQAQTIMTPLPQVWLLTTGTQASSEAAPYAGLWGFSRSARSEALLPLMCIDGPVHLAFMDGPSLTEPETVLLVNEHLVPRLAQAPHFTDNSADATSGSHIISGGIGGLGLLTARWLAQRGACVLNLASRSGILAQEMAGEWAQVQETCVETIAQRCDTAETTHVRRLALCRARLPVMGIWHAAGVLMDGVLPKQTATSLARVYAPKAHGAWTLQYVYAHTPLRTCALFSSVATVLGGQGQANYSAANACLDALAAYRRVKSTASNSVQWGAWAELGMAARGAVSERMEVIEAASGFARIGLAQGLAALHVVVLPRAASFIGVIPVQWHRLGGGTVPALLTAMVPQSCKRAPSITVQQTACAISLDEVLEMVRRTAGSNVDADTPLMQAGVDSLGAVELRNQLQRAVGEGVPLSSTLMFDHPTARQVALHLDGNRPIAASVARDDMALASGNAPAVVSGINVALPRSVFGMGALRKISHGGHDLLCVIPSSRWDVEEAGNDLQGALQEVASRVRHGGFLRNAELFDHGCFSVSAAEASAMDPQQRQLLERGYEAFYMAGMVKGSLLGRNIAANVGQWQSEFGNVLHATPAGRSVYAATGFSCSVTCGRVSFVLGLQGPCASYDTACSASLVANHGSLRALQRFECDLALSSGVNLVTDPSAMRGNAFAGFTSVRGRSHTFDTRADGYARGEAIDAFACRLGEEDVTVAVLGSAVRQDGRSASLTAPSGQAQQGVLMASISDARLGADQMDVLEAHGTGTALGDPIEVGALSMAFLAQRSTDPLVVGSLKANAGHTEPGAGLAGASKLLMQLCDKAMSPNSQLRSLNPHVGASLRSNSVCALPTQVSDHHAPRGYATGGLSSFGYAGTIAHTILHRDEDHAVFFKVQEPLYFRRNAFAWREVCTPIDAFRASICMYSVSWMRSPPFHVPSYACVILTTRGRLVPNGRLPSTSFPRRIVALLFAGNKSGTPSLHSGHFVLAVAHQLEGLTQPAQLLIFTSRVITVSDTPSDCSHGGSWGFARVLRLENSVLYTQSIDVSRLDTRNKASRHAAVGTFPALLASNEAEAVCDRGVIVVARLRACDTSLKPITAFECGPYVITGGLGGLGVCAAKLVVAGGVSRVLLSSRSGTIVRDGQGLEEQLQSIGVALAVLACNSADNLDASALLSTKLPTGLLDAAGVGDKGLLAQLDANRLERMYTSKAFGSWQLQCAVTVAPLETRVLFSSVASGLGNVGQCIYAAGNACLDAQAFSKRARGMVACSLQWPLVGGAGMGAAAFDAVNGRTVRIPGMAGISLEQYARCIDLHLSTPQGLTLSVKMAHRAKLSDLLQDLANCSQPRFRELMEASESAASPAAIDACPSQLATESRKSNSPMQALASLSPVQQLDHVEAMVRSVLRELTGGAAAEALHEDAPLMDSGIDSLAATELAVQLQAHTGMSLSQTLVFEQPTLRDVSSHLFELYQNSVAAEGATGTPAFTMAAPVASPSSYLETSHQELSSGGSRYRLVAPQQRRYRVLFLHGQGTSAGLAHKLLEMRGWLIPQMPFDFVIPDAPHEVDAWDSEGALENLGLQGLVDAGIYDPSARQRMWAARFDEFCREYIMRHPEVLEEDPAFHGLNVDEAVQKVVKEQGGSGERSMHKFQRTIEYLRGVIEAHGPFDGIGGFSEGGATAHRLLCMQAAGIDVGLSRVRFCLALSPWISPLPVQGPAASTPKDAPQLPLRLLITIGRKDVDIFHEANPIFARDFAHVINHEFDRAHEYPLLTPDLRRKCWELVEPAM